MSNTILVGSSTSPIMKNYYKTKVGSNIVPRSKSNHIADSDFPIQWAVPERKVCAAFIPF